MKFSTQIGLSLALGMVVFSAAGLFPGPVLGAEKKTEEVALGYYLTLAEGVSPDAQLVLGDIYRKGDGVPVNLIEAFAWYYLAAQQGVEEAIKPMNDVLKALPKDQLSNAKKLAESYESQFMPPGQ